jgi:hypothetical protein
MQILATEHWSLLATRSMIWNELFTRTSMFITVLSASVVGLALVAQATDFGTTFRASALLILPVMLLLGIGTFIRVADAMTEDFWLVMGMNRLRHAYLDLAPDLAPYFVTGHHDDLDGILQSSGPQPQRGPSRMLSATPTIIAIVNSVLAGVILALLVRTVTDHPVFVTGGGVVVSAVTASIFGVIVPIRQIRKAHDMVTPRFPSSPRAPQAKPPMAGPFT